jgi:hypothetical protein
LGQPGKIPPTPLQRGEYFLRTSSKAKVGGAEGAALRRGYRKGIRLATV